MFKYLSNTMKMTLVVGILFFGLAVSSKAEPTAIDQIKVLPGKVVSFIENEVAKTKEYQTANKEEMKYQIKDTKEDLRDFFVSIKSIFVKQ